MNFKLIHKLSTNFANSGKRKSFLNFARIIAVLSVFTGSLALIISLAVLNGFQSSLEENTIRFTSHISIESSHGNQINRINSLIGYLKSNFPQIKSMAPVLQREGLVKSPSYVDGILFRSFSKQNDINDICSKLKYGTLPQPGTFQLMCGERLIKKLNASVGDSIVCFAVRNAPDGSQMYPEIEKFKISGIYSTGMAKYDDIIAYIPDSTAYNYFKVPQNTATFIEVKLFNIDKIRETADVLNSVLGGNLSAFTVFEIHSAIFAWIELQKAPIPIVLGLISIVAVLNIITILLITVVEKTKSIGILRTLGLSNKQIISVFMYQGMLLSLAGTISGCVTAYILCFLQSHFQLLKLNGNIYFLDAVPVKTEFWHYALVISASVLLSLLSTLIPSYIAVKITPIKALKFS